MVFGARAFFVECESVGGAGVELRTTERYSVSYIGWERNSAWFSRRLRLVWISGRSRVGR